MSMTATLEAILDGVIFADGDGWVPHQRRDGRSAQKKKVGNKWVYRDIREASTSTAAQTDNFMLSRFNMADSTDRMVAADWLTDRGRDKEATFLRSPAGATAILDDGKVKGIHELHPAEQRNAFMAELRKLEIEPGAMHLPHYREDSGLPSGIHMIHLHADRLDSRDRQEAVHIGALLAAARMMAGEKLMTGKNQLRSEKDQKNGEAGAYRDKVGEFARSVLPRHYPNYGNNMTMALAHVLGSPRAEKTEHIVTGNPRLAGLPENDRDANDGWPTKVDYFSLPGQKNGQRSYYYIMSRDETIRGAGHPPEKFTQTHQTPWRNSLQDARDAANSERPWDRRW